MASPSGTFTELPLNEYLAVLVDDVVAGFPSGNAVTIEKELDQFPLDSRQLSSLGIIVNELLANIMKYAFIGRARGAVSISAKQADKRVSIVLRDDGVGIPESFNIKTSTGFGLQLVQMLTDQIGGNLRVERDNGTKWTLEFGV
jgi:two-component sensor histidine kinase